jgi:rod shape-determining protein MreB
MSWSIKMAIDLGTSNTTIWKNGEGVVLDEPSVVAVEVESKRVVAVGKNAKKMIGKSPDFVEVVEPVEYGAVCDFGAAQTMAKMFLKQVMGNNWFFGPEIVIPVASGTTQVEQRAVMDAVMGAGARKVMLVDAPLAAAIGAKVAIAESFGNMVVILGGGLVEAAVIASGGVVAVKTQRQGGKKIDEIIEEYLKKKHALAVGKQKIEEIKINLGSAIKLKKEEVMEVGGRDLTYGLPKTIKISSDEIYELIKPQFEAVVELIKEVLEVTPAELVADVIDRGIVLTGAFAQMRNITTYLTRETGVAVHMALEPQYCVVKGAGMICENLEIYRKAIR